MITGVLFDLDGTLLNRDESVRRFIDNQYDRLGSVFSHIPKEVYVKSFLKLENHGYVWKDKVYRQLIEYFKITEISSSELLQDYIVEFRNFCVPFPHLLWMLQELNARNLRLGMITNGKSEFQMENIRALGIEHYFHTILVSEREGIKKPDPRIFNRALERLGVSASQSVFIGDHPENDVWAAKHVGMKAIWKRHFQWDIAEADSIIDDLAEIPVKLDEW
ncbi:HAD family hydrolase [Mesobacillus foraminis]|uniref:HAD family hydrolase n=1 Tax=Mesobacillus foraminis TaxID=279826 RepID=UPI0039A00177